MPLLPILCVCENVECYLTLNSDNIHYAAKFGTLFCTALLLWKRSDCLFYATLKRRIRGNYRPQRKFAKVTFLHLSVNQSFCSQGGGSAPVHAGMHAPPGPEADTPRQLECYTTLGRLWTRGRHPPPPPPDQRHTPPGPEAHPPGPEAHPSAQAVHAGRYGQQAGGTHPTGMYTCWIEFLNIWSLQKQVLGKG